MHNTDQIRTTTTEHTHSATEHDDAAFLISHDAHQNISDKIYTLKIENRVHARTFSRLFEDFFH